ncbi:hypothetical protein BD410DRAFT_772444 [Rickenella mellea]|uniref:TLC domain-containing protein n=1 Tax=Rickenella mellea TaxID=50990 RepID=A0A4Y7PZK9_9AGAM|nr:hypothetical protein BD410DRAFT_772444 [Rickenella mellea]
MSLTNLTTTPPPISPPPTDTPHVFTPTLLLFCVAYYTLAPNYPTAKKRAWILTLIGSTVMTLASLPFVYDYIRAGWSVSGVRTGTPFAVAVSRVFQAYLLSDLVVGALHYREHVNLVSGWIHHILYIFVVEYAIRTNIPQVFSLAACMELPTFLLSLGTLHPSARSNVLFATTFFSTRIAFHIVLLYSYTHPANRTTILGGSWVPSAMLTAAFGMHARWFAGCLAGFVKRAKIARGNGKVGEMEIDVKGQVVVQVAPSSSETSVVSAPYHPVRRLLPRRVQTLQTSSSHTIPPYPSPVPHLPSSYSLPSSPSSPTSPASLQPSPIRPTLAPRRPSLERALRAELVRALRKLQENEPERVARARRAVVGRLPSLPGMPDRRAVFDWVGLGGVSGGIDREQPARVRAY